MFTPSGTYVGPASFTYMIAAGNGGTSTATANLTIALHQITGTSGADTLIGRAGKKAQIDGLGGGDKITAGSASDIPVGGAGHDTLTWAGGIDTFVFYAHTVPTLSRALPRRARRTTWSSSTNRSSPTGAICSAFSSSIAASWRRCHNI